ncbi:hypothetical protein AAT19DRAFT_13003 [Rhodotorula toruloides]|uniref:Uncharacterized protein n=1 Tax=Rhodotorula toruloides TaxID=5286 RepID=A0A2T0AD98_RHOTO|nr:hypothetical protein AAT19DRAFT_13003 [Rhodotorula toruloides]
MHLHGRPPRETLRAVRLFFFSDPLRLAEQVHGRLPRRQRRNRHHVLRPSTRILPHHLGVVGGIPRHVSDSPRGDERHPSYEGDTSRGGALQAEEAGGEAEDGAEASGTAQAASAVAVQRIRGRNALPSAVRRARHRRCPQEVPGRQAASVFHGRYFPCRVHLVSPPPTPVCSESLRLTRTPAHVFSAHRFDCRNLSAEGLPAVSVLFLEDEVQAAIDTFRGIERQPLPVDFWDSTAQQASARIDKRPISLAVLMKWIASPSKVVVSKDSPLEPLATYFQPEAIPQAHRILTIRVHRVIGYIRGGHMRLAHLDIFSNHQGYMLWSNVGYVCRTLLLYYPPISTDSTLARSIGPHLDLVTEIVSPKPRTPSSSYQHTAPHCFPLPAQPHLHLPFLVVTRAHSPQAMLSIPL